METKEAQKKAVRTYNAASDTYDHPVNSFWERFGRRTVERLQLPVGAHVLDVCSGSGASAIPAAELVGPTGFVLGIDLAEKLLTLARKKAQDRGLTNVDFRVGDFLDLSVEQSDFDVVVCVFGIFFLPDMDVAMRKLWQFVRPGGKLAVTTWGPRFFEPGNTAFWESIGKIRPDLYKAFNPWDRISEPAAVRSLYEAAGAPEVDVVAEAGAQPLDSPDDWWQMVLGSGYRGTVELLEPADRELVRRQNLDFIRRSNISSVEANVIYATAVKTEG